MTANPYPNLGFNPVPGVPEEVEDLGGRIKSAGDAVRETNEVLRRLRNGNDDVWKGAGGDGFRTHFDTVLAQDLGHAQNSLERAVSALTEWHADLVANRDSANRLEMEAAAARQDQTDARTALRLAESNPDLRLAHETFSDRAQLAAAQSRLNAAVLQVNTAAASVTDAQRDLDSIIERARDLEEGHHSAAKRIAAELDSAAKDLAPGPPQKHWWDTISAAVNAVGDWISKHKELLHNILSTVAAIGGLVALLTPPPFDLIGMTVAIAASAANMGLDLSNPQVRNDISDFGNGIAKGDFLHGDFHTKDLGSLSSVGLDGVGLMPGVGAIKGVTSMGRLADEAAAAGRAAPTLTDVLSDAAHSPGLATKGIDTALTKLGLPGSALGAGAHASAELAQVNRLDTIELAWRGKSVISNGYGDIRDWLKS